MNNTNQQINCPQSTQNRQPATTFSSQRTSPADTPFARVLSMTLVHCEADDDGLSRTGLSSALAGRFTIETFARTPAQRSNCLCLPVETTVKWQQPVSVEKKSNSIFAT